MLSRSEQRRLRLLATRRSRSVVLFDLIEDLMMEESSDDDIDEELVYEYFDKHMSQPGDTIKVFVGYFNNGKKERIVRSEYVLCYIDDIKEFRGGFYEVLCVPVFNSSLDRQSLIYQRGAILKCFLKHGETFDVFLTPSQYRRKRRTEVEHTVREAWDDPEVAARALHCGEGIKTRARFYPLPRPSKLPKARSVGSARNARHVEECL